MSDPNAITCDGMPGAEELEAFARKRRESVALWMWGDDYYESEALIRAIIEQAKEEVMKNEPWTREYLSTL